MMRCSRPLSFVFLLGFATLAAADSSKQWLDAYRGEVSSDARRKLLASLPAGSSKALPLLLQSLMRDETTRTDWYVREGALEALAKLEPSNKKARKLLKKVLGKPKPQTHRLRATLVEGLARSGQEGFSKDVIAALGDPSAQVRRAAAYGLTMLRSKKGAVALMKRLDLYASGKSRKATRKVEADQRRELFAYTRALEGLSGVDHGFDVKAWRQWWASAKLNFELRENVTEADRVERAKKVKEEAKQGRVKTVERGVTVRYSSAGRGKVKLLVLHDDSWSGDYFEPWLEPLHDLCEIFYVKLPDIADFDEKKVKLKRAQGGMAYMPVDAFVDALDGIRKSKGIERFALMTHGFSALIGARYVTRHADRVSHVIYLNGLTGDDAYGKILEDMQKTAINVWKDLEARRMVENHYLLDEKTGKLEYEPKDDAEGLALQRKAFALCWADPEDAYVGEMFEICRKPVVLDAKKRNDTTYLSPEFDISREKKPPVPALVMVGKKTLWANVADCGRLAKNYRRGELVVFENSGMFPFIEEPDRFIEVMRGFFENSK